MDIDLNSLISHLGTDAHSVLEGSSSKCVSRGGYEITIEDFLLELLETPDNEFKKILKQFEISEIKMSRAIQLSQDLRSGNTSHPVFPTPGSPTAIGLFFRRLANTSII